MKSSRHNCSLAVEYPLVHENILIQNERIAQLFVIQSANDPLVWFGVLFVDAGIYKGSVIRFTLFIDDRYPNCPCPRVIFEPIPYHPLVDPETGELDTKNAFPDWNSNTHKLHQLLSFVKRVIYQADTYIKQIKELMLQSVLSNYSSNNLSSNFTGNNVLDQNQTKPTAIYEEISDSDNRLKTLSSTEYTQSFTNLFLNYRHTVETIQIYENDYEGFLERIEEFKKNCSNQLFDRPESCSDDKNTLIFREWNTQVHEPLRDCVLGGKFTPTSWFASYHKESDSVSFIPGSGHP